MTKAEVVTQIAKRTGIIKSDVNSVIEAFCALTKATLKKGDFIYIRKFGSFLNKKRAPKVARNIKNNTSIFLDSYYKPHFKPSKLFIEEIKNSSFLKEK